MIVAKRTGRIFTGKVAEVMVHIGVAKEVEDQVESDNSEAPEKQKKAKQKRVYKKKVK